MRSRKRCAARRRPQPVPLKPSFRPAFEVLEERWLPSSITLQLINDSSGGLGHSTDPRVEGQISDPGHGIAGVTIRFDGDWEGQTTSTDNDGYYAYTPTVNDGTSYSVSANFTDDADNNVGASLDFTYDVTAPTISLTVPAHTNSAAPWISIIASDNAGLPSSTPVSIDISSDNTNWALHTTVTVGNLGSGFVLPQALPSGTSYLRARVSDRAGHQTTTASTAITYAANPTTYTITGQQRTDDPAQATGMAVGRATVFPNTGNLQLLHALDLDKSPGTSTGGDPFLVYNSSTVNVRPLVEASLMSDAAGAVPSSIQVQLTFNGTAHSWVTFSTSGHAAGDTYLLAARVPNALTASGLYPWKLDIRSFFSSGGPIDRVVSGVAAVVVHDVNNPFTAPGWFLSHLDQLVPYSGGVLWVYGSGGSRVFTAAGGGSFTSPANDLGGSLVQNGDGTYTYTAKDQTRVEFGSDGWIRRRVDTHNLALTYTYSSGQLSSITAPDGGVTTFALGTPDAFGSRFLITEPSHQVSIGNHLAYGSSIVITDDPNTFTYSNNYVVSTGFGYSDYSYDSSSGALSSISQYEGGTSQLIAAATRGLATSPAALASQQGVAVWTDALSQRSTYTLDALGRPTQLQTPDGAVHAWVRDSAGQVIVYTDPLNRVTTNTYSYGSGKGDLTQVQYPDSSLHTFSYDSTFHHLTQFRDSLGRITTYTYDSQTGDLLTTQNALGQVTTQTWSQGLLQTVTDPLGHTTSFLYDSYRRLQVQIDALQGRSTFSYDSAGNPASVQDPLGHRVTTVYDSTNHLVSRTDALSHTTSYTYNGNGDVTGVENPLGTSTAYTYNNPGWLTLETQAVGSPNPVLISYTHDALGRTVTTIDGNENTTTFTYDPMGRQRTRTRPGGGVETWTYDLAGQLLTYKDALAHTTSFSYHARGWRTAVRDPLNHVVTTVYDTEGNALATLDALGNAVTTVYDALNRPIRVEEPTGGVHTTVYDAAGNSVRTIDALAHTTTLVYDALNRRIATIDSAGGIQTTVYDSVGHVVNIIDSSGNKSTFIYYAADRKIQALDPNGNSTTYQYDAANELASVTDRLGRRLDFSYDELGRLSTETWVGTGNTTVNILTYTYDNNNNLQSASDANSTYVLSHDALNRVSDVYGPFPYGPSGFSLAYTYDAASNRIKVQDSFGGVQTSTYDAANRLTNRELANSGQASIRLDLSYNARNELTGLTRNQGPAPIQQIGTSGYSYDSLGRISHLQHGSGSSASNLANYTYTYDVASRLLTETLNSTTQTYTYDTTNQLTGDGTATYTYDPNGNRTMTGYQTGTGNRLTTDGTWTYTYDAEGNLTKKSQGSNAETWTYGYDHHNHMTSAIKRATDGGTLQMRATYTYDVFGNRIEKAVDPDGAGSQGTTISRFVYVGQEVWADLNSSNALQTRYLHGNVVDQIFARLAANGTAAWYLTDRQGSVRDVTDASGAVQDHIDYGGFGNVLSESNASFGDRYKYTGRELDSETGLQYNRARPYDPKIGRLTSEDPKGFAAGDNNFYRYVQNGPTNATDPYGLQTSLQGAMQNPGLMATVLEGLTGTTATSVATGAVVVGGTGTAVIVGGQIITTTTTVPNVPPITITYPVSGSLPPLPPLPLQDLSGLIGAIGTTIASTIGDTITGQVGTMILTIANELLTGALIANSISRGTVDIDNLQHYTWVSPSGQLFDLMLDAVVSGSVLTINDAHIMPHSGTYDESRGTLGVSGLRQLGQDIATYFGVSAINIVNNIGRTTGGKGSFGPGVFGY